LEEVYYDGEKFHNLYLEMKNIFAAPWVVIVYVLGCISLSWHLLHGVQSAAQTLGWTNKNFFPMIKNIGIVFSILIPLIFALMPLALYFGLQLDLENITLLF
jgi:succinate dehydrogenase / fumarate reductase cytochrome b subunit